MAKGLSVHYFFFRLSGLKEPDMFRLSVEQGSTLVALNAISTDDRKDSRRVPSLRQEERCHAATETQKDEV